MRRYLFIVPHTLGILGIVLLNALLSSCQQSRTSPREGVLKLTTGGPTSPGVAIGEALGRAERPLIPGIVLEQRSSIGSVDNVEAIQSGQADIGLATADVVYFASIGQVEPRRVPFDRLRGIAV